MCYSLSCRPPVYLSVLCSLLTQKKKKPMKRSNLEEKLPRCGVMGQKVKVTWVNKWRPHIVSVINPLIATLKPQSNGPSYSNTMIGTLAVDG